MTRVKNVRDRKYSNVSIAEVQAVHLSPGIDVLVLNYDYTPLNIVKGRRAIVLLMKQRAQRVSEKVIRLLKYTRIPLSRAAREKPTKVGIYRRDGYTCQYCGSTRSLTIDHLIPKSRGGTDSWENVLIACSTCNVKKGNKLLQQTGMVLKRKPRAPLPKVVEVVQQSTDPEWSQFGFFS
jgi:5-methylcytosine-specific restriction endonuclease McrA